MTGDIILAIAQIFGVCFIGWLASRLGYLNENDVNRWSRLLIDFLFPLLVFQSIVQGFDAERVRELWSLPLLGFGIIVVGALLQIGAGSGLIATLAFVAVLIATINIVGGFTVTHRMLKMFRKD